MDFVQQMAAAGAVLALLAATLWWLRRKGHVLPTRRTVGRRLECLERLSLGPQQTLHLVRLGENALLLASTPSGCTLVAQVGHGLGPGGERSEPSHPQPLTPNPQPPFSREAVQ